MCRGIKNFARFVNKKLRAPERPTLRPPRQRLVMVQPSCHRRGLGTARGEGAGCTTRHGGHQHHVGPPMAAGRWLRRCRRSSAASGRCALCAHSPSGRGHRASRMLAIGGHRTRRCLCGWPMDLRPAPSGLPPRDLAGGRRHRWQHKSTFRDRQVRPSRSPWPHPCCTA